MDAKPCEAVAEHEIKEQQGGPPVKGNWRTSIYLGMEMIRHATTAKQNIIKEIFVFLLRRIKGTNKVMRMMW